MCNWVDIPCGTVCLFGRADKVLSFVNGNVDAQNGQNVILSARNAVPRENPSFIVGENRRQHLKRMLARAGGGSRGNIQAPIRRRVWRGISRRSF